jgi:hypothetical protein
VTDFQIKLSKEYQRGLEIVKPNIDLADGPRSLHFLHALSMLPQLTCLVAFNL